MFALLIALASAHHPGGVARVSNDSADVLGMPFAEGEWRLDSGFGLVVTPFDHVQRGGRRGESVRDVVLLPQTPSARVWLPSATFVQVSGPLTVGEGVQAWTHTPDVNLPDRTSEDAGVALPGNRSHGVAISPSLSVAPTQRSRCGGSIQLPIWQWMAGSQLAPSYRMSAQCQVSSGKPAHVVESNSP